jgi:hypothetical protein
MSLFATTIPKLNSHNYVEWKFVLEGFFLEEAINITEKIEDGPKNGKALRLLRQSVRPEVIPHIDGIIDAFTVWKILETRYGSTSVENRFATLQTLLSLQKIDSESIPTYTSRAWTLFNKVNLGYAVKIKLENPDEPADADPYRITETVLVALIINGLPKETRIAINRRLNTNQAVTYNQLELTLQAIQREDDGKGKRESPIDLASSEVSSKKGNQKSAKKKLYCFKCKKSGHHTNSCKFKLPTTLGIEYFANRSMMLRLQSFLEKLQIMIIFEFGAVRLS